MALYGNDSFLTITMASTVSIPMQDQNVISPMTLNTEWSRFGRLLFMTAIAVVGSVGNVYMISALIVEEHLSKRGNTFLGNTALADFIICGFVVPASAVAILAGTDEFPLVCHGQWFLAILCGLTTMVLLTAVANENYLRLCRPETYEKICTKRVIVIITSGIWLLGAVLTTLQFVYKIGPDYCAKSIRPIAPYQAAFMAAALAFLIVDTLIMYIVTIRTVYQMRQCAATYKPCVTFDWDYHLMIANLVSFILFLVFWTPFVVMLLVSTTLTKRVSARLFYNCAGFALSKSCISNILYCCMNEHFRTAYLNLFNYCCCKTTVSFARTRTRSEARPSGDVRVHIIPGYNVYPYRSSESRASGGGSGDYGKKGRGRANIGSRDVYQL